MATVKIVEHETLLMRAAKESNFDKLIKAYETEPESLNYVDENFESALIHLGKRGDCNCIKFLLRCPGLKLNIQSKSMLTFTSHLIERVNDSQMSLNTFGDIIKPYDRALFTQVHINPLFNKYISKRPRISCSDVITPEQMVVILNDDIDTFKDTFENFPSDAFYMAYQHDSVKIIRFCIENSLGFGIVSSHRMSALTFLFFYERGDLLELYLEHGGPREPFTCLDAFQNFPLSYSKSRTLDKFKLKVLYPFEADEDTLMDESQPEPQSFDRRSILNTGLKQFSMDDFRVVKYVDKIRGGIGFITHAIESKTGRHVAIKRIPESYWFGERQINDLITETLLMRHVAKYEPDIVAKVYGFIFDTHGFAVVFEHLQCDLSSVASIFIDIPNEDKKEFVDYLMKRMIEIVDRLASLGIVHGDIKGNNFMLDSHNNLKLIDFGFSSIYGVTAAFKTELLINPCYVYPPDRAVNYTVSLGSLGEKKISTNLPCLTYDVFSLGNVFLEWIFGTTLNIFSDVDERKIYWCEYTGGKCPYSRYNTQWSELARRQIIDYGGEDFYDLIINMICSDSNRRFYPRECLMHKYFSGVDYQREPSKPIRGMKQLSNSYRIVDDLPIRTQYFEDIHRNYIDLRLPDTSSPMMQQVLNMKMYYILINWLFDVLNSRYCHSIDQMIDLFNRIWKFMLDGASDNIRRQDFQCFSCIFIHMSEIKHSHDQTTPKELVYITDNSFVWEKTFPEIVDILRTGFAIDITPVSIHISYVIFKLQQLNFDNIEAIEAYVVQNLIKWSIYNDGPQPTVWELISNLVYSFLNRSIDENEQLSEILSNVDDAIQAKIRDIDAKTEFNFKIQRFIRGL